jgi:hypothetical protein
MLVARETPRTPIAGRIAVAVLTAGTRFDYVLASRAAAFEISDHSPPQRVTTLDVFVSPSFVRP